MAKCNTSDLQVDVPLFSDIAEEHNRIVGAKTFYKTVRGLYNLALFRIQIGIRIVVHRQTYKRLPQLADFIYHNFPFVSQELQTRFGLHGYVAAYVLPEEFQTTCPGVEYAQNKEAEYAVITVTEPMIRPFERIPTGYKHIMEFLQANNFKEKTSEDIISCFEHEYEKDGVIYMDIYVHAAGVTKVDAYSTFN